MIFWNFLLSVFALVSYAQAQKDYNPPATLSKDYNPPTTLPKKDVMDPGIELFLSGDIDGAINSFQKILKKNPYDSRIKEILGNCFIIKGKRLLSDRKYQEGKNAFKNAESFLPDNQEIKILRLLSELDEKIPSQNKAVSTTTLHSSPEMWAVFDCIFGVGKCAPLERYLIHTVREGETMSTIAQKYFNDYTLWEEIWKVNPKIANPHRLKKGVRLIIPLKKRE